MSHPKGLYLLFVTEMAERFSYYGMRALFVLYLIAAFYNNAEASQIFGSYTGLVYLTPLLGGYISDRYWGNRRSIIFGAIVMAAGQFLMFASACLVQQSIFSEGGQIDHSVDNSLSLWLMFAGLAALIVGNGFFKPNISTMVGDLYSPQDSRKDSAFTIFYMGINAGALIAPPACAFFGNGNWADPGAFKWGFFCAGVAMLVSLFVFVMLKDRYLCTPDGLAIGMKPSQSALIARKEEQEEAVHETAREGAAKTGNSPVTADKRAWRAPLLIALGVLLLIVFSLSAENFNDYISAAIYAISIALPVFIITDGRLTRTDRMHIGVIYIIAVFVIFFWSAFEQAGSSLTLFAEQQCDRHIGTWEMPTPWFQSINPIVVVLMAPVMAVIWETLAKRHLEPSSPVKQAIGLMLLSVGYFVIAYGTYGLTDGQKASMWWLFALYFIHTIGELSLSPIGLSMVSRLSPTHLASLLMGVWFMSNATSNVLAGKLATLLPSSGQTVAEAPTFLGFHIVTLTDFFLIFAIMSGVASVLLFCLCPTLKKMMQGVR